MTSCLQETTNYVSPIYDHRPFELGSQAGCAVSIAKRVMIGLIVAAALAVATYYLDMATNIWGYPVHVQQGLAITNSCFLGVMVLAGTAMWSYGAVKEKEFANL